MKTFLVNHNNYANSQIYIGAEDEYFLMQYISLNIIFQNNSQLKYKVYCNNNIMEAFEKTYNTIKSCFDRISKDYELQITENNKENYIEIKTIDGNYKYDAISQNIYEV